MPGAEDSTVAKIDHSPKAAFIEPFYLHDI